MATKLKGREYVLMMERGSKMVPVCFGRELELTVTSDLIEITKAPDSTWRRYLYGMKGYNVSTSGLVIIDDSFTINDFYDAIANKKTLAFVALSNEEHDVFFSGKILITQITKTGSYKDVMTYSIQATGDGPLNNINPYEINILTDGDGNPIEDGEGNMVYDQDSGGLLPINLNINC